MIGRKKQENSGVIVYIGLAGGRASAMILGDIHI
jgi:hypothetical protein